MQVRPITREEHEQARRILSTAFISVRGEPNPEDNSWKQIRAAFEDGGDMAACVFDVPFVADFNGAMVGMCGIGGVASLPEYRRKGHVRAILRLILADAYRRGDVLSTLYPFSFVYYRKFGYEVADAPYEVNIPMTQMAHYKPFGSAREYVAGDDRAPYKAIYRQFAAGRNFACDRDDDQTGRSLWEGWLSDKHNSGKSREYIYLWRDDDQLPGAYAMVRPTGTGDEAAFEVYDYAWVSLRALRGLLGFLRLLEGQAPNIRIRLPEDLSPHTLFPEPYDLTVSCHPRGMVRLVNVGKGLETLGAPGLTGEMTIGVTDDMLPGNAGTWRVIFSDGKAMVEKTNATPEWTVPVGLLSQMVSGVISFEQAACLHDFAVDDDRAAWLNQVFPKRKRLLIERF